MHDDRSIVEQRLDRVVRERINPAILGPSRVLEVDAWEVPGEPVSVEVALAADFTPFAVGSRFGRPWGTTWFRIRGEVPDEWAGHHVAAHIDLGFTAMPGFQSEGLVWAANGDGRWEPIRAVNPLNHEMRVHGGSVDWLLEAASNPAFVTHRPNSNSDLDTAGHEPLYRLTTASLVVINTEVRELREDIRALRGLMKQLPLDQPRRHEILRALEAMLDTLVLDDIVGTAADARRCLADVLAKPAVPSAHRISAIGHAHIDSAWLWPVRETIRKCARTFSNVLDLMDSDPDFRFGCSQAAQYEWMREHYPSIFARIKERVADGRWIPIGGMWVEADTNLAGGEALIRQITHGQRYFEEHFGVTCSEVWIPDVFGYSASLPQIMSSCGIDRFLTQKLSWNKTNRFPHHTFWWEGIDGSTVFTHFPPVETYNATFNAAELAHAVRTFNDKGRATRSLMPFGHGDGGGGPTPQMMGQFRRVRDLEGSPRVQIEAPEAFFDAAIAEYPDAPRWVGELYFEMHRGTFTSQAGTKAGNRRCELLLREAELWCTVAYGGAAENGYPADELDRLWKVMLFHQFHDILPGSSIGWVHREAEAAYTAVSAELETLIEAALARISGGNVALANPAPHAVTGVVVIDVVALGDETSSAIANGQRLSDGRIALEVAMPAMSVGELVSINDHLAGRVEPVPVSVSERVLDNGLLRVELDDDGLIVSILHRDNGSEREVIPHGCRANMLQLHEDFPNEYDAWDIEDFYRRHTIDLTEVDAIEVLDVGPLIGRIKIRRTFGASSITQVLELAAGSSRLDVACEVEWHHQDHLLKVAFPVDVHADEVTRDIQFGHITTPIHTNTSWDLARFEVCAHRWIDVGEPGYGVALLNDSKYGHDVTRSRSSDDRPCTTMRLTLLRGPQYPDPVADQGHHRFTYSLMPHAGDFRSAGVIAEGYRMNAPVRFCGPSSTANQVVASDPTHEFSMESLFGTGHDAVVVEAVKAADDGSGDIVVRCYESWGGRASVVLPKETSERIQLCDSRERPVDTTGILVGETLNLRPFQIVTLRVPRT